MKGKVAAKSDVSVIDMAGAAAVTSKVAAREEVLDLDVDVEIEVVDDYSQRGQWLRAALLGANDGLVSTASLMMGVGAVKADAKAMLLSGLSGLVAGACSMAIGEFVSVYSQLDVELSQIKRENNKVMEAEKKKKLPNPIQAASASAMAFTVGALVPLLSAAFIKTHLVRMGVLVGASSVTLAGFGAVGAYVGKSPGIVRASVRVLLGGWAAMLITYGMLRLFGSVGI